MRYAFFLAAFAFAASTAWSQAGAHAGGVSMHPATGHTVPQVSAPHTPMGGHVAPFRPSTGNAPIHTVRSGSRAGSLDTQGNWTSYGFVPSANGYGPQSSHEHRDGNNRYGSVGYPIFGYPGVYLGGGLNIDDNDPNDPNQSTQPAASGYTDNAPPDQGGAVSYGPPDTARAPYNPSGYAGAPSYPTDSSKTPSASSDGMTHPRVTLIFKDGRTPLKIQNYALSRTKIFIRDNGTDRDIAISDLDVPATMSANDQAGVDFALPVAR